MGGPVSRHKLNERQPEILQRIAAGTDPVTSREHTLAVTVYALRDRGLISTDRRHGHWTAEITEAGRYFLEHGRHPDDRPFDVPTTKLPKGTDADDEAPEIEAK